MARLELKPQLANADVILAIDSDLLSAAPGHLRIALEFAARRNPTRAKMNRLYAIEATPWKLDLFNKETTVAQNKAR